MPHIIRGDVFRFIVDGYFGHQKSTYELWSEDATATNAKLVISLSTARLVRLDGENCRTKNVGSEGDHSRRRILRKERRKEREGTEGFGYMDSISAHIDMTL